MSTFNEDRSNTLKGCAGVLIYIAGFFIGAWILMLLWNWLMPTLFGISTISYLQAIGWKIFIKFLIPLDKNTDVTPVNFIDKLKEQIKK